MPGTKALVIVAHPDDETLWSGGEILAHADRDWTIVALCRRGDADRAPRFFRVLERLGARGAIGDLDDGPDQIPLEDSEVEAAILGLTPAGPWDVVYTHSPFGEYTRHLRHEETASAVVSLWRSGALPAREVRLFAYEDGGHRYYPKAIAGAHETVRLDRSTWENKRDIVVTEYGFAPDSWEAQTTPHTEAFWRFDDPADFDRWHREQLQRVQENDNESFDAV